MEINKIHISESLTGRLDPHQFHPERMDMLHRIYSAGRWCKLKDVVNNVKTTTTSLTGEDIYIGLENIVSNTGEYIPTSDKDSISSAAIFKIGDILFPKLRPYLNKVYRAEFSGKCSTEFHVFAAKNIDADFLTIILRSNIVVAQTKHLMTGNTLPRLQTTDIENLIISLPPVEVQKEIVELYTKAQNAKQVKEKEAKVLLESIDDYILKQLGISLPKAQERQLAFKVKFSDILGDRLNPLSYNVRTLALKKLMASNSLNKKSINDLLVSSIAGDWGVDEEEEESTDEYVKCLVIRATEFDNKYNLKLDNSRVKYRKIKCAKLDKMDIQEDDILIEKSGGSPDQPVGRVALITKNIIENNTFCYSNFIHKIRLDKELVNPEYAYYFLSTMYRVGMTESMQSQTNGIRNLIMSSFLKQLILLPQNQKEITEHIRGMYSKARKLEKEAYDILETSKSKIEKIILK